MGVSKLTKVVWGLEIVTKGGETVQGVLAQEPLGLGSTSICFEEQKKCQQMRQYILDTFLFFFVFNLIEV